MIDVAAGADLQPLPLHTLRSRTTLPVRWDRIHGDLQTHYLNSELHAHRHRCVFECVIETQPVRFRHLFDPWSAATWGWLSDAQRQGDVLVRELDADAAPLSITPDPAQLHRFVQLLRHLREVLTPAQPAAFLRDATAIVVDNLRRRSRPAALDVEGAGDKPEFITAMVSDEHVL